MTPEAGANSTSDFVVGTVGWWRPGHRAVTQWRSADEFREDLPARLGSCSGTLNWECSCLGMVRTAVPYSDD